MNKLIEVFTTNYETIKKTITARFNIEDSDDLMQELYLILAEKEIDTPITDDEYFLKYIYNTAYYTFIYKYSKYNKNKTKEDMVLDNEVNDNGDIFNKDLLIYDDTTEQIKLQGQLEELTKKLDNKIRCYLNRKASKCLTEWYKVELFKKYYFKKMSYRKIGKETNIHYTYVHLVCKVILNDIKTKYNKDIANIEEIITLLKYGRNNN